MFPDHVRSGQLASCQNKANFVKRVKRCPNQIKLSFVVCSKRFGTRAICKSQTSFFGPSYIHHDASTPDLGRGPEGEKKRATLYRNAFQDFRLTVEELLSDGETITARWSCRGTHKGELNEIAPTGKQISITGISVARFAGGKMVEGWVNWDALGLMRQLGAVFRSWQSARRRKVAVARASK